MFRNVVVAVDGSKHAMKAAVAAIDIAKEHGSKLHFLTVRHAKSAVVDDELRHYMEIEHLTDLPDEMVDDESKGLLGYVREQAAQKGVDKVETVVRTGQPARCIVDFAREVGADLIMLGSRGLGDVGGFLLGSVSHKVSSLAEVSCLIVK